MTSPPAEGTTPAPKASLFNRPTWAKKQSVVSDANFFSRSDETYLAIAAEIDAKKKRKAALKAQHKAEILESGAQGTKRRRVSVSSEGKAEDVRQSVSTGGKTENEREIANDGIRNTSVTRQVEEPLAFGTLPSPVPRLAPQSPSKRSEGTPSGANLESAHLANRNVINLDDDDDDNDASVNINREIKLATSKDTPLEEDGSIASDDEFPELTRMAREKARRKRLQEDLPPTTSFETQTSPTQDSFAYQSQPEHQASPPPPPVLEPIISILITSSIEGTAPLIVNRRLNQRLKDVRITWCRRQEFPEETIRSIVLIWRGRRLFDATSCKSLGIGVDADGSIVMMGEADILGEENRQIHMEAMTEEMFKEMKQAKARPAPETQHVEDEEVVEEAPQETPVKIILKAPDFEDFKLIVKPSTLISRIVGAFRSANQIAPEKDVYLLFDGDRLEPSTAIGETEISDLDYLDVYIR